jgi:hypothetical protein
MTTKLEEDGNVFGYQLLQINQINYEIFINSKHSEEIIFSILSNFGNSHADNVILKIIQKIEETSPDENSFKRYFQQLRTLSQLRNLEPLIDTIMDSIANYVRDENDILFIIGKKQEQEKFVKYLLNQSDLTMEKIAELVGVTMDFVNRVKDKVSKQA